MDQQAPLAVEAAEPGSENEAGVWGWIQARINLAFYRPQAAPGVVASRLAGREGVYYVLRTADAKSYLKLTEADYILWTHMDGQRNVKDLVVLYFVQFGAFAFDRVAQLVRELQRGGFLADRPLDVLAFLRARLDEGELASRGQRLAAAFVQHEIPLYGIDRWLGLLYRASAWLYTRPVQLLLVVLIVAGMAAFVATLLQREMSLLTVHDSFWLGVLALLAIQAVMILFHELAHGLTTKHFGRQVRRGGFLIYYGYPAFFVDTMDMWLENRWARIAVSWAGPHSGLLIGGLAALLLRAFPETAFAPWLFKTAFVAYLTVFFNLNPLLELDGYFILIDLLDVPMLRQRAFGFVRHQLWHELRDAAQKLRRRQADWLAGFTREERLLAVFGLLAALYTLYSLWVALFFWQTQVITALRDLWHRPGWLNRLLLLGVAGVLLVTAGGALLAQLLAWGRRAGAWLEGRGVFQREREINLAVLALLALLVVGPPVFVYDPWWSRYLAWMPPALLGLACANLVHVAGRYRGAGFQRVFEVLLVAVGLLALGACLHIPGYVRAGGTWPRVLSSLHGWAYNLENLAAFPLALAGFFSLAGVELRHSPRRERVAIALLIAFAGLVALPVARWTNSLPLPAALLRVSSAYLGLVFVAAALPNLAAFAHTRFFAPWLALVVAALITAGVSLLHAAPAAPLPQSDLNRWLALASAGTWALATTLFSLAVQRTRFPRIVWEETHTPSEEERLRETCGRFFAGVFESFQNTFGRRGAQSIAERLNALAGEADWQIEIAAGRIADRLDLTRVTIWEQAERYRELLSYAVELMTGWAGHPFVTRTIQAAYDSLPWLEREALGRYVLADTRWGAEVAARFAGQHDARWRLVRALPLFARCDDRALGLIVAALVRQQDGAGAVLARQGAPVDRFVLVESGAVEVWRRDERSGASQLVAELRRGASLGERAFFGAGSYDATYRASTRSSLLVLDADACARLLRSGVALATRIGASLEVVRLLGGMPLFSHLSPQQLSALAGRVRQRTTLGTQVVAHMGSERHSLFIVLKGTVEALADDAAGEKYVAHVYTPGEHFGEYALFADTPYQFTYRTRGPATLLTLDEATFDALVTQSSRMASYVEQVGSGRLLAARSRER